MKPLVLFLLALASFDPSAAGSDVEAGARASDAPLECIATSSEAPVPSLTCNQQACSPGPAGDSACRASGCSGGCGYGSCLAF
jgi:hypothetical protein